ncbi:MAG: hypothetical protein AAGA68_02450 [Pseudomonadota bacterium]
MRIRAIGVGILAFLASAASHSAGWTGWGLITEISQQPATGTADVLIVATLPNNPTSCTDKDRFLFDVTTGRDERTFSMLLAALAAGQEVRLFVTDGCPQWDMPKITGAYIRR